MVAPPSPNRSIIPRSVVLTLFLLSGATSLVYEVVWLRLLILIFGSTLYATSTILSTFMGGLAGGAWLAGRFSHKTERPPLILYGILEIFIGLYALLVPTLFHLLSPPLRWVWNNGGSDSFLALSMAKFVGIALVLLPPTLLMGASLPILARQVARDRDRIGSQVGTLYAVNTFGAVLGTFAAGFLLIPGIGVQKTILLVAAVNIVLGLVSLRLGSRDLPEKVSTRNANKPSGTEGSRISRPVQIALVAFFVSGFVAMVLEVSWARGLALVVGNSVYAFSLMLIAFLIGLASGGAWFARRLKTDASRDPGTLLALLLAAAAFFAWATAFLFQWLPRVFVWVHFNWDPSTTGSFGMQLVFGLAIMFPATFMLGGIFPAVLQLHARSLDRVSASVGTVYAANTLGTILGAACAGFLILPALGVRNAVIISAAAELLVALLVLWFVARLPVRKRTLLSIPIAAGLLMFFLVRPTWNELEMNSGVYMNIHDKEAGKSWEEFLEYLKTGEIVYLEEGLTASVLVADQPEANNRYLAVNGKVEASTQGDMGTQILCSHLPLILHPDPQDVLLIGLASGISAGSAAAHPIKTLRVLEVEKEMIGAAKHFTDVNNNVLEDPRLEISINDARNELEFSSRTYDVIISEPSNPWMTVASNLFTEEFFELAATRLRDDGIFLQWIQNYYLPSEDLRSIVAALHRTFPEVILFETGHGVDFLLVGSKEPIDLDLLLMEQRINELRVRMDLARIYIRNPWDIFALLKLGPDAIARYVEGAGRNSDDNARVEFSAPKSIGMQTIDDNLQLLDRYLTDPISLLAPLMGEDADLRRQKMAVAFAYNRYLERAYRQAAEIQDPVRRDTVEKYLDKLED